VLRPRLSRTVGTRENQVARLKPLMKKRAKTAFRQAGRDEGMAAS
jgi:hypothetical protein